MKLASIVSCLVVVLLMSACQTDTHQLDQQLEMSWQVDSVQVVDGPKTFVSVHLKNVGTTTIDDDWGIYYTQLTGAPDSKAVDEQIVVRQVAGTYYSLKPTSRFDALAPGETRSFAMVYNVLVDRLSSAPQGVYAVFGEDQIQPLDCQLLGLEDETFAGIDLPTAASRFAANGNTGQMAPRDLAFIPTPTSYTASGQRMTLSGQLTIAASPQLANELGHLKTLLGQVFDGPVTDATGQGGQFNLQYDSESAPDAYDLTINPTGVTISGGQSGVFYGIQSLARLLPKPSDEASNQLSLPLVQINDAPRFAYRGLHFDVSRNFHSLDRVKRVVDVLAYYKINKLHLTLTNDEGWRIEIPGLPELTELGSRRGHTTDESDRLYPAYGSGPYSQPGTPGSGFYTRDEYIDLLQYADSRHIEIIPEIDVPGHARASIVAMIARYKRLMAAGDESGAKQYLLHDPDDASEYRSAQLYNDNVVCVCQQSTYDFVEKVIDEVVKMHQEANAPLTTIHSGGDEVPYGAWQKSPICQEFIQGRTDVESSDQLHAYFMKRFDEILKKHDLRTAGWEEIALKTTAAGHNGTEINTEFLNSNFLLYVWNSVWGWGREDMAYKLANTGYDIVMCNSGALYFDLAYNRDPQEGGLTWSGVVDTRTAFEFAPYDIFTAAKNDIAGNPLDKAYVASKVRLQPEARANIKGIQGQLWGETLLDSDLLDYYLFPKLLGLAQRAWSTAPQWASTVDDDQRFEQIDQDWNMFANTVGIVEMPRLDNFFGGIKYRIPLPGGTVENGIFTANVRYPGLELRYTLDGSEPTADSPLYEGPVSANSETIKIRAFDTNGRGSRTSVVKSLD